MMVHFESGYLVYEVHEISKEVVVGLWQVADDFTAHSEPCLFILTYSDTHTHTHIENTQVSTKPCVLPNINLKSLRALQGKRANSTKTTETALAKAPFF